MPRRGARRWLWLGICCVCAALLGLAAGVGVAVRGRSLGQGTTGETVSRPTFVIGVVASVSPIPGRSPSPVVAQSSPSTDTADYIVQPGDTLRSIADSVYGDADQWPRIYDANRELIGPDPDALQAGMRLRTP
jgi:nucleoid-associated protein YgaU